MMIPRPVRTLAALSCLTVAAACGDDPIAPEVVEPVQIFVEGAGLTLATATEFSNLGTGLAVAVGVLVDYDIVILIDDGVAASPVPRDPATNEFLEVSVADTAIARWETATPGSFAGGLRGVSAGTTEVVFRVKSGTFGDLGAELVFEAFAIPVTVSP